VLPDLILMDITRPVCDGLSACRLLKADLATRDIPLIFLTAAALPRERVEGLMARAVDYITKPFTAAAHVQWGEVGRQNNAWLAAPQFVHVTKVVEALRLGAEMLTV
jgi:CheY-like chemotaxis protein